MSMLGKHTVKEKKEEEKEKEEEEKKKLSLYRRQHPNNRTVRRMLSKS